MLHQSDEGGDEEDMQSDITGPGVLQAGVNDDSMDDSGVQLSYNEMKVTLICLYRSLFDT